MSDRIISEYDLPYSKVHIDRHQKKCKKEDSFGKKAIKTAAKIAISGAITGDVSGAATDFVVGGIIDKI